MEIDETKERTVVLGKKTVFLDPAKLSFNETNLNAFICEEAAIYDNYGQDLALAEYLLDRYEQAYEELYSKKFAELKDSGGSDALVKAKVLIDPEVSEATVQVSVARYKVNQLKHHLRAWDRAHDNAQSFGHNLRKEMDKLGSDIFHSKASKLDAEVDKLMEKM
jgi:hypothetical protein